MPAGLLFTYLLFVSGFFYGFVNPFYSLMVYYAFAILRPELLWGWSFDGNSNRFSLLVALSTIAGWLLQGGMQHFARIGRATIPLAAYGVYIFVGLLSIKLWALDAEIAATHVTLQAKVWLMGLVTVTTVRTEQQIRIFAWVITACLGYLAFHFNSVYFLDGINLFREGGLMATMQGDNNTTALTLVVAAPLAYFIGMQEKSPLLKLIAFGMLGLLLHAVLLSNSRGGMLGMLAVGFLIFVLSLIKLPNKALTLAAAVLAVALVAAASGPEIRARFSSTFASEEDRDDSAQSRLDLWAAAWDTMKSNPMGVGPECFPLLMENYGFPKGKYVHSVYFQTGADYGFIGLFGFVGYYVGTLWLTLRLINDKVARRLRWPMYYGIMVSIGMTGYLVSATFLSIERVEVGFIAGLVGVCTLAYVEERRKIVAAVRPEMIPELAQVRRELVPADAAA